MKKLIALSLVLAFCGCAKTRIPEKPKEFYLELAKSGVPIAILAGGGIRRGNAATKSSITTEDLVVNPLAAYREGQDDARNNAAEGGYSDALNKLAAKDTDWTLEEIVFTGANAHRYAAQAWTEGRGFTTSSSHELDRQHELSNSNSVKVLELRLQYEKEKARLEREYSQWLEDQQRPDEPDQPDPPEPGDDIPGGNPFDTVVSDKQDPNEDPDITFLWKPVRETDDAEAAILFPFPLRIESVTVNGESSFRRNSLSNGWRSTWYGPRMAGEVTVVAIEAEGKAVTYLVPDATQRYEE